MINIKTIQSFLKEVLDPDSIPDIGINGIQIENELKNITNISFSVDASIDSINLAINNKCELLIVHHGFFWGKPVPIIGSLKKKIELLINNNIGLIAYHLPLDCHRLYGNNIQILKKISSNEAFPFGFDKGFFIGWQSQLEKYLTIDEICKILNISINNLINKYLDFGNKNIKKIAVVSGSGTRYFDEAIYNNIDLFITGDSDHILYHKAKENNINVLFAGHYYTETFGLKALEELIKNQFNVKTTFLDIPTNL